MALFNSYQTDKPLEKSGIVYTPDAGTAITIARAGGANIKFSKRLEKATKPYRRQIDGGGLDQALEKKIMAECYAYAVIKNWETLISLDGAKPALVQGIEASPDLTDEYEGAVVTHGDTVIVPFTQHNVVVTLLALPDLFTDIQQQAMSSGNYLLTQREEDAKK